MTTDADKYEVLLTAVREALAVSDSMNNALDNNASDSELSVLLRAENKAVTRLAELSGYKKGDKPDEAPLLGWVREKATEAHWAILQGNLYDALFWTHLLASCPAKAPGEGLAKFEERQRKAWIEGMSHYIAKHGGVKP